MNPDLQKQLDEVNHRIDVLQQRRITQESIVPNIVLRKPNFNASSNTLVTNTDATTIIFDLNASDIHSVTLGGNRTLQLKNITIGQRFTLRLIQDTTGSRTVTWFTTLKWAGVTPPTLTTTANRIDVFQFLCISKSTTVAGAFNYDGAVWGQNLG